jgi:pimeloyl-ACP methyl ester carboxylesterase
VTRLVLLPGLDGTGLLFGPLLEALPPALEPQVVTYPGDRPLGYRELLPLVLDRLPAGEPYLLLGESFSGPLAVMIAAAAPPGLRGLVLAATFVRNPLRWVPSWARALCRPWLVSVWPGALRDRVTLGSLGLPPPLLGLMRAARRGVSPPVAALRARETMRVNVEAELRACPVPVLCLAGARDTLVPAHNLARIRHLRPDAEVVVLETAHMVLQTAPREAARAIGEFAARQVWR